MKNPFKFRSTLYRSKEQRLTRDAMKKYLRERGDMVVVMLHAKVSSLSITEFLFYYIFETYCSKCIIYFFRLLKNRTETKKDFSVPHPVFICMEMAGGGRKRRCSAPVRKTNIKKIIKYLLKLMVGSAD